MKIENSVILITGGGSGIGEELANYLNEKGGIVYVCDIQDYKKNISKKIRFIKCDVSIEDDVKNMVDKIKDEQGRIDILINNAGIGYTEHFIYKNKLHSTEMFEKIWKINALGCFLVSKYVSKIMVNNTDNKRDCNGVIIMMSSVAGIDSPSGLLAYGSSKAAVIGMTLPMARDLSRYRIRVNAVAPGFIDTPMFHNLKDFKKLGSNVLIGKPIYICQTCEYIITCDYINGTVVRVDNIFSKF